MGNAPAHPEDIVIELLEEFDFITVKFLLLNMTTDSADEPIGNL